MQNVKLWAECVQSTTSLNFNMRETSVQENIHSCLKGSIGNFFLPLHKIPDFYLKKMKERRIRLQLKSSNATALYTVSKLEQEATVAFQKLTTVIKACYNDHGIKDEGLR